MNWLFNGVEQTIVPEGFQGFVYCITNLLDGRRYFGKKNYWFAKTKTVKGKKKRIKVESDWQDYYGSSEELKADIERLGAENFSREILHQCKTKGMLSYMELKLQMLYEVLERPTEFYNRQIHCRIHASHVKL